jgi:4'-phosphopantetheinyl transferase
VFLGFLKNPEVSVSPGLNIDGMRKECHFFLTGIANRYIFGQDRMMNDIDLFHTQSQNCDRRAEREHGRELALRVLALRCRVPVGCVRIETTPTGKPVVAPETPERGMGFNLSHTPGMMVCALARDADVGVDVENHTRRVMLRVADRFFSDMEIAQIRAAASGEQANRFIALWTLKEAYLKATGQGLSSGMDHFGFDLTSDPPRLVPGPDTDAAKNGYWHFYSMTLRRCYRVAVAVRTRSPIRPGIRIIGI